MTSYLRIPGLSGDQMEDAHTKREILKAVASIFDPLGVFCTYRSTS